MINKELIETSKEIVVAMINSKLLVANTQSEVNKTVTNAIEEIYNKLVELNSKEVIAGNSYNA